MYVYYFSKIITCGWYTSYSIMFLLAVYCEVPQIIMWMWRYMKQTNIIIVL